MTEGLLRGSPARVPDRHALASPAARLLLGVPQLLVRGDRDDTVPATMARAYHDAPPTAGDRVELSVYPGGHFEHLHPGSPAWGAVVAWLEGLR